MNLDFNEWGVPLAVLVLGVLGGVALLSRQSSDAQAVEDDGRRRDLQRERAQALEALKHLELEKDKLSDAAYEEERRALLARGAAALKALESNEALGAGAQEVGDIDALVAELRAALQAHGEANFEAALRVATGRSLPTAASTPGLDPAWRGALSASVLWLLAAVLIFVASDDATPRPEMGGSMTGAGAAAPAPGPDLDQQMAQLQARVQANPKDIEALNGLTQLALDAKQPSVAMEWNRQAFEVDPTNAEARIHKAVLAAMVGMNDRAISLLKELVADQPENPRAIAYLGLLYLDANQPAEAVQALERAVALQPNFPPLQQALQAARQRSGIATPAPSPANGPAEVVVSGTASLGPNVPPLQGGELLFVSVRDPAGGPPLAALRLPAADFPIDFQVTTADAIAMGGAPRPFPETLSVSVRIDKDGNAMTREGAEATDAAVTKGTSGLKLTLE